MNQVISYSERIQRLNQVDDPNCPLFGFEAIKRTNKQLKINNHWLLAQLEIIHDCLCSEQKGTWQTRVKQAVEAAKEVKKRYIKGD